MLLALVYMKYKKLFELVVTGDNTKKYKKYSIFIKDADVVKNCEGSDSKCKVKIPRWK